MDLLNKPVESTVESAALTWLESLGWQIAHGRDIAPDGPTPERTSYDQVLLETRLRDALTELNPELPKEALEKAFKKLTHPEGADTPAAWTSCSLLRVCPWPSLSSKIPPGKPTTLKSAYHQLQTYKELPPCSL